LSCGDDSSGRDNGVGSDGTSLFQLRSLKNNALESDVDLVVYGAAIQRAVVGDVDVVAWELSQKSRRLPILTEAGIPVGKEEAVWMTVLSPMLVLLPILAGKP
jgi:hypothetical protein